MTCSRSHVQTFLRMESKLHEQFEKVRLDVIWRRSNVTLHFKIKVLIMPIFLCNMTKIMPKRIWSCDRFHVIPNEALKMIFLFLIFIIDFFSCVTKKYRHYLDFALEMQHNLSTTSCDVTIGTFQMARAVCFPYARKSDQVTNCMSLKNIYIRCVFLVSLLWNWFEKHFRVYSRVEIYTEKRA